MKKKVEIPFTEEQALSLECGDNVFISGVIYTGRDTAHKRMIETIEQGNELPMNIKDGMMYYVDLLLKNRGK